MSEIFECIVGDPEVGELAAEGRAARAAQFEYLARNPHVMRNAAWVLVSFAPDVTGV
jgi:hypothetical protein